MSISRARMSQKIGVMGSVALKLGAVALIGFMLSYLKTLLIPLVLAAFVVMLLMPLVNFLAGHRWPRWLAVLTAQLLLTVLSVGVIYALIVAATPVVKSWPKYQAELTQKSQELVNRGLNLLSNDSQRQQVKEILVSEVLPTVISKGGSVVQKSLTVTTGLFGSLGLTWIYCLFILLESHGFRSKFASALGRGNPVMVAMAGIATDVRAYVIAKTFTGLLTGLCLGAFLSICGVDFAMLWGLIAFPLNFIPTLGCIIAIIPPLLCAFVDPALAWWAVLGIGLGMVVINGAIGSFVEPRVVGQAVNLSPLVVFLSMMIWGVLWGTVGMILGVPLVVAIKLVCARIPTLKPISIILEGPKVIKKRLEA